MGKAAVKNDLLLPDEIIEEGAVQNPMRPFQQIFSQLVIKEFLPNSLQLSFNPHKFVQVVTEFYNTKSQNQAFLNPEKFDCFNFPY